jgi:16S rRNA (guanine527-N7)-methyltransferase
VTSARDLLAPHVPAEALERLVVYVDLLERWSARHSLVRFRDRRELVERHVLDSLAGAPLVPETGTLLDVGSGAGLPGIPLLCARPGVRGTLLEPRQKRWAFLRLVIRELDLDAIAATVRYQDLPAEAEGWSRVTCRAVGAHDQLLEWAKTRIGVGGAVMLWITEEETARLRRLDGWRVVGYALPRSDRGQLTFMQPCFT